MGYRADGIDVTDYYVDQWARSALPAKIATAEDHQPGHEGAYNVVVARQVIEHVRDPLSFLRACAAMIVPGGACLIETGDPSSWQARFQRGAWNYWVPSEGAGSHVSFINSRAAEALGQRSNLRLRDSVPQLRYTSLQSYVRGQGRGRVDLHALAKFFLHQSRLSSARCYWFERT
jgi:2-polyprenyl-3-methyl-5-hydroxy-6-metoxy-1,4-benzoquinol methylase